MQGGSHVVAAALGYHKVTRRKEKIMSDTPYPPLEMDPEWRAEWLQWLRDPANKQGRSLLCRISPEGEKSYCCLGGLCEIAIRHGVIPPGKARFRPGSGDGTKEVVYGTGDGTSTLLLPKDVADAAGMIGQEQVGMRHTINPVADGVALAGVNDDKVSFDQIADLIEGKIGARDLRTAQGYAIYGA